MSKHFIFESGDDADMYFALAEKHREEMDNLIEKAKVLAAEELAKGVADEIRDGGIPEDFWQVGDPVEDWCVCRPLAELLTDWVVAKAPTDTYPDPNDTYDEDDIYTNLLARAIGRIGWYRVAQAFMEKVGEDEPEASAITPAVVV